MIKKTILVADSNKYILSLIKENIELSGYRVVTAYDNASLFQKIISHKPDLIILDILLPGINGLTLNHFIKNVFKIKSVPIIAISGDPDLKYTFKKINDTNIKDWLQKPFDVEVLL